MRLLYRDKDGNFSFAKALVGQDLVPLYAILSHIWGPDSDKVIFEDIINSTSEDKPGYKKLRFCGEQARQDGL